MGGRGWGLLGGGEGEGVGVGRFVCRFMDG